MEKTKKDNPIRHFLRRIFAYGNGIDLPFFLTVLALVAIGLIALYSASYAYAYHYKANSYFYIRKQLLFALAGVVGMILVSFVDYHVLFRTKFLGKMPVNWPLTLSLVSVALLVLVLGMPSKDARRWISIPVFGQFQPSELAKFAMILLFAYLISQNQKRMKTSKFGFWLMGGLLAMFAGLVAIEPHMSGAILLGLIGVSMMFIGGTRVRDLLILLIVLVIGVYVVFGVIGYEKDRIAVFLDPMGVYNDTTNLYEGQTGRDAAWQTVQSLYAIGSGGLLGQGLGNSRQKHLFLPEPQNDFIFSVWCEELGFIGAALVILLFALLVWRGFRIAAGAKDKFGSLLAIGITLQIGFQVALNIAVVSNAMPNTGISLPFFSYGGTSLIMLLLEMGVVLSVSRQSKLQTEEKTDARSDDGRRNSGAH